MWRWGESPLGLDGLGQGAGKQSTGLFSDTRPVRLSLRYTCYINTAPPFGGAVFMVEVGRVELPSENMMTQLSTSVAVVQVFPLRRSQRRDRRSGSFIKSGPGQSLPGFVPYPE